ncbi:MAG: ABC transporter permease [Solirubrobacterales bacterium]
MEAHSTSQPRPVEFPSSRSGTGRLASPSARATAKRVAWRIVALAVVIGVWWAVAAARIWDPLILPPPSHVWDRFIDSITVHDGETGLAGYYLWQHLAYSFLRVFKGLLLAIVLGVPVGILLGVSRSFSTIAGPYVNFVRALPPLAYFSLLIIWFGINDTSKVLLLFLAAFPPIAISIAGGVAGIPKTRIDAARSLGASRTQLIRTVVIPSTLPEFFTGLRLAIGFACTTVVAAETVNGLPGIGGLAWMTQKFLQTDVAILCVIVIGLAALALDLLVRALERIAVPWRGRA